MEETLSRIHLSLRHYFIFWLLAIATLLVRFFCSRERSSIRRVAIVEPYGLGDIVSLQPLVSFLVHHGWSVHIVAQERWQPVLKNFQTGWSNVSGGWSIMGFKEFFMTCWRLKNEIPSGSIGIDPRGDVRSIFFLALAGCPQIYSLDHYIGTDLRLPWFLACLIKENAETHQRWQITKGFADAIESGASTWNKPDITHLVSGKPAPAPQRIGIVPVAPWKGKLWRPDAWAELINQMVERGYEPVVVCGPNQHRESVSATSGSNVPIAEAKTIKELAETLRGCRAIVTLDTGPMHIASALNVPVVALFGTGQLPLWGPFSDRCEVVISPGFPKESIHQVTNTIEVGESSMREITCAQVWAAITRVL